MMEQKIIEDFKKLVAGFRALTTKFQNSSHNKTKNWKDTNLELEACKRVSELVSWVQKFEKLKMDDFENFFKTGKVSYNMLRYKPGLAKVDYQVRYIQQKRKENMQMTLTKTINYWIQHSNNERTL